MACSSCNQENQSKQANKAPLVNKQVEEKTFSDKPRGITETTWEGSLLDLDKQGLNINSIIRIIKISDNKYLAVSIW